MISVDWSQSQTGNNGIAPAQPHSLDAGRAAAHGPHICGGETDGHAVGRGYHNMVILMYFPHGDKLVVLAHAERDKSALAAAGIQRGA